MTIDERREQLIRIVAMSLIVAGGIAVAVLSFVYYRHQAQNLRDAVAQQLLAVAELKARELEHWRRERESDARFYRLNPSFQRAVRDYLLDEQNSAEVAAWLRNTQASHGYEIKLLDPEGQVRMQLPAGLPALGTEETAALQLALAHGAAQWVDFHRRDTDSWVQLSLAIPLADPADPNKTQALMLWRLDPQRYLYPMLETWATPNKTAETLLVRREGDRVRYLSPLRFSEQAPLEFTLPLDRADLTSARAVLGARGVISGVDYRGEPVLSAAQGIDGTDWVLIARIDQAEAEAPLLREQLTVLLQAATLLAGLGILAGFLWRRGEIRHLRRLHELDENLRRNEELLQNVLSASPTVIYQLGWESSAGSPPRYISPNLERLTGYTLAEAMQPNWWPDHVHPDDRAQAATFAAGLIAQGQLVHEYRFLHKDGRTLWIRDEMRLIRDAAGQPREIAGAWTDITTKKQQEEELRLKSAALDAAANAIFITNREGRIEWANEAFTRLTGYTLDEVLRRNPKELVKSGVQGEEFYRDLWNTILAGRPWSGELVNRRKDGTHYSEEMMITPVKDAAGAITHFIAIKQNITDRKLLQEQYLKAQRLESLGMLAAGIAHDLNNMLAPIIFAGPLLRRRLTDEKDLRVISMLESSAERGAALVKQVVAFAQGGTNVLRVTQLKHVARDVVAIAQNSFPKSIRIQSNIPADAWPVMANPSQIHQVLLNLLVNARDAMPDGGTLTVALANRTLSVEDVANQPEARPGDWLLITVGDTGTGIPPDVLPRIFDAFFTTKAKGKGSGLGLTTVRTIVQAHHGFIKVESEPGRGTTMRIFLPASREQAPEEPAAATGLPEGQGELILLVDDDPSVRESMEVVLRQGNYRVLTCSDGVEAIVLYQSQSGKIDLVITDVDMPNLNGAVLAATLHQLQPSLRIIAISGLASAANATVTEARRHARAFLQKPFGAAELLRTVHEVLHPPA
ncbi:MAG: PAS domain S-box protein [Opitutaceae bacterium]|nr:PAS domain S-box protein [Opitutaceae bacterium]